MYRKRCMPAHGRCERVARERAGGERVFVFACQKEKRVPPSNKAASEAAAATLRWLLNAGRRNLKERLQTNLLLCGSGRGFGGRQDLPPKGALARPGCGAGRGLRRAVKPRIEPRCTRWRAIGGLHTRQRLAPSPRFFLYFFARAFAFSPVACYYYFMFL